MSPFEVRTLPISELVPADYNPRTVLRPESSAYRKLRASLSEFGLVEPLVWNATTRRLVGGHARLRILTDLGITHAPVSVVHLTEAKEKALNVVLNNAEAQGRYDPVKLAALLDDLSDTGDLTLTGFDDTTLATLRFEPRDDLPIEPVTELIEITIRSDRETFHRFETALDALVREFDLEIHVRK